LHTHTHIYIYVLSSLGASPRPSRWAVNGEQSGNPFVIIEFNG